MPKVTFANRNSLFFQSVKKSVDDYFKDNNIKKTGNWSLYIKALTLIPIAISLYIFLLFSSYSAIIGISASFIFSLVLVSIAFNVMHDACHGSFSSHKWVNSIMGLTMNALGSDAFLWKVKHNIIHHTYTNVDGVDDDMSKSPVLRMCPQQEWKPYHKYQFIYMFVLYALSTFFWLLIFDFQRYFSRKLYRTPITKIELRDHITFWIGKISYIVFYVAVPILILGWVNWLIGFAILHLTMGLTLTIVFQLAHIVEITHFDQAGEEPKTIEHDWAIHQVKTTADFAPQNKIISWLVGGLNFQIEHHLFPKISHIHYPALSKIIQSECAKFDLPYNSYPTTSKAIASHMRFMIRLGSKDFPHLT